MSLKIKKLNIFTLGVTVGIGLVESLPLLRQIAKSKFVRNILRAVLRPVGVDFPIL
jgi:hypothetical protein